MPTINEVAKRAGMSVATVSRVLNNSANVSHESRKRVQEAIDALDYSPNMLGSNLRKMRSGQILVMVPTINNPFYSSVIEGIQSVAHFRGYRVLVANTYSDFEQLKHYIALMKQKLVDGVILLHPVPEECKLLISNKKYPIVQGSEFDAKLEIPYVGIDDVAATGAAITHLLSVGRTKIAMLNSDLRFRYALRRQEAFIKTLENAGLTYRQEWIKYASEIDFEMGLASATELLESGEYPDAIFCVSDVYAAACIKAVRNKGLRVPEDVAIVGFDNVAISVMTDPAITTVSQPMHRIGSDACKMLLNRIDQPDLIQPNIILPADLLVRQSTLGYSY
jgi:alanine racemase